MNRFATGARTSIEGITPRATHRSGRPHLLVNMQLGLRHRCRWVEIAMHPSQHLGARTDVPSYAGGSSLSRGFAQQSWRRPTSLSVPPCAGIVGALHCRHHRRHRRRVRRWRAKQLLRRCAVCGAPRAPPDAAWTCADAWSKCCMWQCRTHGFVESHTDAHNGWPPVLPPRRWPCPCCAVPRNARRTGAAVQHNMVRVKHWIASAGAGTGTLNFALSGPPAAHDLDTQKQKLCSGKQPSRQQHRQAQGRSCTEAEQQALHVQQRWVSLPCLPPGQ